MLRDQDKQHATSYSLYHLTSNLWLSASTRAKREMTAFINTVSFQPGRGTRLMLTLCPERKHFFLKGVWKQRKVRCMGAQGQKSIMWVRCSKEMKIEWSEIKSRQLKVCWEQASANIVLLIIVVQCKNCCCCVCVRVSDEVKGSKRVSCVQSWVTRTEEPSHWRVDLSSLGI